MEEGLRGVPAHPPAQHSSGGSILEVLILIDSIILFISVPAVQVLLVPRVVRAGTRAARPDGQLRALTGHGEIALRTAIRELCALVG